MDLQFFVFSEWDQWTVRNCFWGGYSCIRRKWNRHLFSWELKQRSRTKWENYRFPSKIWVNFWNFLTRYKLEWIYHETIWYSFVIVNVFLLLSSTGRSMQRKCVSPISPRGNLRLKVYRPELFNFIVNRYCLSICHKILNLYSELTQILHHNFTFPFWRL